MCPHIEKRHRYFEEVGQLLTRHHSGLDWPSLLESLRRLSPRPGTPLTPAAVRPLAALFVEVFALSSKISLVLDDDHMTDRIASIFARHADPSSLLVLPSPANEQQAQQDMDGLVQDFAEVDELASVTTLPTLYATVRRCVQITNDFVAGLVGSGGRAEECLSRVLQYLVSKSDQSKASKNPKIINKLNTKLISFSDRDTRYSGRTNPTSAAVSSTRKKKVFSLPFVFIIYFINLI
jgi:hypothetical protein